MHQVIPIFPCYDVRTQCTFYEALGFETKSIFTSPNPYLVLQYDGIVLHFYGTKRMKPEENASMCFIQVDDVDRICGLFTKGLKDTFGKVPRSGFPKITKVRDLKEDRRFTLTDPAGNTLYIGTQREADHQEYFRTLDDLKYQTEFALLYDLIYSKEDLLVAGKYLPAVQKHKQEFAALDLAKLLLLEWEINADLTVIAQLNTMIQVHQVDAHWQPLRDRVIMIQNSLQSE